METPTARGPTAAWLRPTWRRFLAAMLVALAGFLAPQGVPLVWYPLNEPGQDILYLEISCAADRRGEVQVFYATGLGINERDSIRWPVDPTETTYTYIFPLPDAPVTALRLDSVASGGALTINRFRIIDRRGTEVRRFSKEDIIPVQQIAAVEPVADGWKIISAPGSNDPFANIRLPAPIIAKDINHRNLLRCLLSTGYLTLMLWILLLAVLFAFYRPSGWKDGLKHVSFMAALAVMFSLVGNRGLIKNSVRYARFVPPAVAPGASLQIDVAIDRPQSAQLFWDSGQGFSESNSVRAYYAPHTGLQTLRFPLPPTAVHALRFDPIDGEARLSIRDVRVVDSTGRTLALLPARSLEAGQDIAALESAGNHLLVTTAPGKKDPVLNFDHTALQAVNAALKAGFQR